MVFLRLALSDVVVSEDSYRVGISLRGRHLEQLHSLSLVFLHISSFQVACRQVRLCLRHSRVRRLLQPFDTLDCVLLHGLLSGEVVHSACILCERVVLPCRFQHPFHGFLLVGLHSAAVVVGMRDVVLCDGVSVLCRFEENREGVLIDFPVVDFHLACRQDQLGVLCVWAFLQCFDGFVKVFLASESRAVHVTEQVHAVLVAFLRRLGCEIECPLRCLVASRRRIDICQFLESRQRLFLHRLLEPSYGLCCVTFLQEAVGVCLDSFEFSLVCERLAPFLEFLRVLVGIVSLVGQSSAVDVDEPVDARCVAEVAEYFKPVDGLRRVRWRGCAVVLCQEPAC